MIGAHHAACGAAAWVALTTNLHVDLTMLAAKARRCEEMSVGWGVGRPACDPGSPRLGS
jgi:hypothetical protein